jgi:hypothetical protein
MNNNRRNFRGVYATIVVVVVMALFLAVQTVAAATIPQTGPVQVGPFQVTLQSATFPGDHTSNWTYKIELTEPLDNAVSHTSLGLLDPQCVLVSYSSDGTFRTEYPASQGGIKVVKWEDITEGLKNTGDFHTFTLTVLDAKEDDSNPEGTYVAVKYGTNLVDDYVEGPICGTTAVSMASVNASSGLQTSILMIALALGATVVTAGALRKNRS